MAPKKLPPYVHSAGKKPRPGAEIIACVMRGGRRYYENIFYDPSNMKWEKSGIICWVYADLHSGPDHPDRSLFYPTRVRPDECEGDIIVLAHPYFSAEPLQHDVEWHDMVSSLGVERWAFAEDVFFGEEETDGIE